jgi:signal transduction histidine kinase/ligand-binding sensor domain-containing protein
MSKRLKIRALFIAILVVIGMVLASCNRSAPTDVAPPTEFAQPIIQPLKFSKAKKIDWSAIKAVKVEPVVTKLNWNKLPETSYDTAGFKPFKYPVEETKFDYNSLPSKDLDIDKLPSHPLKFNTYILPPPKLIKGAKLQFKNGNLFSLGFGEDQKTKGVDISSLFYDRDGFLWIATAQGIYRYDGENLLLFIPLEQMLIFGMVQDDDGNIWSSANGGGIGVLDTKTGILKISGTGQGLSSTRKTRLTQDMQHRIWVTSWSGGVDIIDPKTKTVKWLDKAHGLSLKEGCFSSTMDKNGNIWIGDIDGRMNIIDLKNKKIKWLGKENGLKTTTGGTAYCDAAGRIWVGLNGGIINIVDLQKNSIQTIGELQSPKPFVPLSGLIQANKNLVWASAFKNGVDIIYPDKRMGKRLKKSNGLISDDIVALNQDKLGNVWIASREGLNMIIDNKAFIERIGKDSVNTLLEDHRGLIWATTPHGDDILDRKKHTGRHLGFLQGLAMDNTNLIKEINGSIFITTDSGLDIVDTVGKTISHVGWAQGLSNNYISTIVPDKTGRIWMGMRSEGGINVYDRKNQTLKHIGKAAGLSDGSIADICMDIQGRLWVATYYGGIDVIDPNNGSVQYLKYEQLLKDQEFKDLLTDNKGNIWIGTSKGIYFANLENQTVISFTTAQGLINDKVLSLLEHSGKIYAGTNQGITAITPPAEGVSANKNWQSTSYGLTKTWMNNFRADVITNDGLYWSGDIGTTVLDLSKKDTNKSTPYITGISVYDHPVQFIEQARFNSSMTDTARPWPVNGDIYYLKGQTPFDKSYARKNGLSWDRLEGPGNMPIDLQVPYNQNFIQFHYSSLNFTPRDSASYKYILLSVDKDWSDATSNGSTINYMNLQPGDYTFEVISRNANNVWSEPAKFSFTVNPPWSRTWWAYLIYVSLIAGAIWCFVYYRSRQLIKEKRVLEQKVQARTEEVMQQKEEIEAQRDDLDKAFKDLKATQTQLIQSEKMASLGELTAGIAHEIQNPLNFVNNFSEVNTEMIGELEGELKAGNIDEALAIAADIKDNEQKINHHGQRADAIVKGMLQHSRASSGAKEPTDINTLADEYLRLAYHGLRAKDKSFNALTETHFDAGIGKLNINPQEIGRVILNLLNNAFYAVNEKKKTNPEGYEPTVTITTKLISPPLEGRGVELSVRDNGAGIPQKILDKIYQPFFTTKPTGQGTGLGLSMSYDIIKAHGGELKVETKEGEFTEFIVTLPLN